MIFYLVNYDLSCFVFLDLLLQTFLQAGQFHCVESSQNSVCFLMVIYEKYSV